MATTKYDHFHDDLHALMRKYGLEVGPDKSDLANAFYALSEEAERAIDAQGPAHPCEHCGGLFTRLHLARDPKGDTLGLCWACRDGIERDIDEQNDPANGPDEHAFNLWANRGLGRR